MTAMKEDKKLPKIIEDVGFDFRWSQEKVWALDVPTEEMDIEELAWHFDVPFWNSPVGYYDLSPNQVLDDPDKFKAEFDRTMNADLSHPLDIMFWRNKWLLLDGLHRLVKAKKLEMEKVNVRKIPKDAVPLITK